MELIVKKIDVRERKKKKKKKKKKDSSWGKKQKLF